MKAFKIIFLSSLPKGLFFRLVTIGIWTTSGNTFVIARKLGLRRLRRLLLKKIGCLSSNDQRDLLCLDSWACLDKRFRPILLSKQKHLLLCIQKVILFSHHHTAISAKEIASDFKIFLNLNPFVNVAHYQSTFPSPVSLT